MKWPFMLRKTAEARIEYLKKLHAANLAEAEANARADRAQWKEEKYQLMLDVSDAKMKLRLERDRILDDICTLIRERGQ